MTRSKSCRPAPIGGTWMLQDAKARFSEMVRQAHEIGPQHVTVRGREAVVVVAADEYRRLSGGAASGMAIVDALQACPAEGLDMDFDPIRSPVRPVEM